MTDRGTVTFGATKYKLAWFTNLPAALRPGLRTRHHAPNGFAQVVTPLSTGNAGQAFEIYAGRFAFAGQIITAPPSDVFTLNTAKPAWRDAILSLDWLADFNASNRGLHDQFAMRLVHYWSTSRRNETSVEKQTRILISLATHGQMIARRCTIYNFNRYFEIIAQELKNLLKLRAKNPEQGLWKAIALLYCLNSFEGLGQLRELAYELVEKNLELEFLADGGHVSRNAQKLIGFLELVIPLQMLKSPIMPPKLSRAAENGLALLKLLQCPSGSLSGLLQDDHDDIHLRRLLKTQNVEIPKLNFAPHSGFARIDHSKATLITDTSMKLGLDFFDGNQKLLQTQTLETGHLRPAIMQTAAQGTVLTMKSTKQKRTCFLSADGHDLRIEDEFGENRDGEIVISIAPGIKLSSLMDGQAVMLVMPDQAVWHLKQRGGKIHIRQSNMQSEILIHCNEFALENRMNWSLKKQAKTIKNLRKKVSCETELLI